MFKRLLPLLLFAFPLALVGEDELPKETPRPAIDTYRHIQTHPYIKRPEGITAGYKKFTISPQTLPDPYFRYRLHIVATEKEVGNAYPLYVAALKKFHQVEKQVLTSMYRSEEYHKLDPANEDDRQAIDKLKFKAFPLYTYWGSRSMVSEITAENETQLYYSLREVFQLLEKASKKTDFDWSDVYEDHGVNTSLEFLQEMRTLTRYLSDKANWEIRNGKFDDAVRTIRVGYALGNHVWEAQPNGFMVGMLIGAALHSAMNGQVYFLSAQPGAPNLYPTLMQINVPYRIYLDAVQTETKLLLPQYHDEQFWSSLDTLPPERAKALFDEWLAFCKSYMSNEGERGAEFLPVLSGLTTYLPAKNRLLQKGFTEQEIEDRTTFQVMVPYIYEELRQTYDYMLLDASMPMRDQSSAIQFEKILENKQWNPKSYPTDLIASMIFPAKHTRAAWHRIQQSQDLLKIVSVLRYYAAVHDGQLPKSLDEITELAVPKIDPLSGKPYEYHSDGKSATIDYRIGYSSNLDAGSAYKERIEIVVEATQSK